MEAPPLRLGVKGKRADLDAAFGQLRLYALALENPPLLIVSDMLRFRIRTNWTNSVSKTYEFGLDDLTDAATRNRLKWAVSDPGRLRPGETRQSLTEQAAQSFATVAQSLRERRHAPNARVLVASRGTAAGHVAGARRAVALHRNAERRQAPTVCLVRRPRLPRSSAHRDRQRRRYDLRHPAQPISRDLVTAPLHVAREGERPALHAQHHVRDVPVPARPDAGHPRQRVLRRSSLGGCSPGSPAVVELRDRWLNPPEWVDWVDEPVPGYPKRPVPRDEAAAKALKKRTLTNLYNARPQWLADAHNALDAAAAAAYGWSADISGEDALRELLALNRGDL